MFLKPWYTWCHSMRLCLSPLQYQRDHCTQPDDCLSYCNRKGDKQSNNVSQDAVMCTNEKGIKQRLCLTWKCTNLNRSTILSQAIPLLKCCCSVREDNNTPFCLANGDKEMRRERGHKAIHHPPLSPHPSVSTYTGAQASNPGSQECKW